MRHVLVGVAIISTLAGCVRHPIVTKPVTPLVPGPQILKDALTLELTRLQPEEIEQLIAERGAESPGPEAAPQETFKGLNAYFFGPEGFKAIHELSGPESVSVASVLQNRRGTCMGLAVVYLAMAEGAGLNAHGVSTPDHLFIRVDLGDKVRNVELLEKGRAIDDEVYRRRHGIQPESIEAGVFMRNLTDDEVIAHLLSNQAVVLSKEGKYEEALARYQMALDKAPQLVAAYYNRGLQYMRTGRLQEALQDFDWAIELHPGDAEAFNNRGLTKVKMDDLVGARADFERALELQPAMREARENLKGVAGLKREGPD